jgi:hypothetical protein
MATGIDTSSQRGGTVAMCLPLCVWVCWRDVAVSVGHASLHIQMHAHGRALAPFEFLVLLPSACPAKDGNYDVRIVRKKLACLLLPCLLLVLPGVLCMG